jgi:Tfp pilus assembly protein PilX
MTNKTFDSKATAGLKCDNQAGTATLTAVLIVALLSVFVAASIARVTTGQTIMNNDYANSQAFYAAQASLEEMTRNFDNIYTYQLTPTQGAINQVQSAVPAAADFPGLSFNQLVTSPSPTNSPYPISNGPFAGLTSYRNTWQLDTTATSVNQAQVHLTRQFYSHKIPIFQFGIFYNGPLTIHPGPDMFFSGRVHSNDNIYVMCQNSLFFTSVVTAAGQIIRDWNRNGETATAGGWTGNVYISNPSGTPEPLNLASGGNTYGSVMNESLSALTGAAGDPEPGYSANNNANYTAWNASAANFGGNVVAHVPLLQLPIQLGPGKDPSELIKRPVNSNDYQNGTLGQTVDDPITSQSRYANKPGIRISLSDTQAELPGGNGGIRLDGDITGTGAANTDVNGMRGYMPKAMLSAGPVAAYQATRVNGFRLFTGANYPDNGTAGAGANIPATRQTWIKVELVNINASTLAVSTTDVTTDFLSLGVTYQNPNGFNIGDSRAILCMQRYEMLGAPVTVSGSAAGTVGSANIPSSLNNSDPTITASNQYYGLATSIGVPMTGATLVPSPTTKPTKNAQGTPTTAPTTTQVPSPTATVFPLPVHTYYMNSAGTGINYVSTGNYSPSMNYPVGGLNPAIYNPLNGTATSTPYYSGYTSILVSSSPSATPNPTPAALGAPISSLEASEFGGSYTANGWKPTATPNPTPGVATTLPGTPATPVYVLPFPIEFFDTREGLYNVNTVATGTGPTSTTPVWDYSGTGSSKGMYPYGNVPKVGIISGIDINIANMTTLLKGTWDGAFPLGVLSSTAVPTNPGWIIYVSDRRGDRNDNGNYDMEDIYGPLDGVLQPGEDANGNGVLDVDTTWEAAPFYASAGNPSTANSGDPNYLASIPTDIGAFFDHQYFRRAVRLINGSQLPGGTTLSTGQVVGFTVSAENPIYIIGDYNSTGVSSHPANNTSPPTAPANYAPNYGAETSPALEVPASVVADAVYILSNNWLDSGSFRNPLNITTTGASGPRNATETTIRAAFFTGLTQGSIQATPNQGGGDANLDGGVHNFPRMLENWATGGGVYMNYCGSMVNDFASHQALGAHKNGGGPSVYNAPLRNWTFDTAFLNVNDMPPGTPLFQFVQMTGFHQTTTQEQ